MMRSTFVHFLVQTLPVVISLIGTTTFSAVAIEAANYSNVELKKQHTTVKSSSIVTTISHAERREPSREVTSIVASDWGNPQAKIEWSVLEAIAPLNTLEADVSLNAADLHQSLEFERTNSPLTGETSSLQTDTQLLNERHVMELAQVEPTPNSNSLDASPIAQDPLSPEAIGAEEVSPRWRFSLTPYAFIPFLIDGSVSIGDVTVDFTQEREDVADIIQNQLNFAAAARVEAWRGNLGFIFDGAYVSVGTENTAVIPVPNCLCNIFPSEIETELTTEYGQFDLGVGYRFAENASSAATEFELGTVAFDVIAGIRIYSISAEIDISTNVGTNLSRDASRTLVTPLLGGQFRWNTSPNFAGWLRTDLAGFGIDGKLMAFSITSGIDWMFSGNTSLQVAYRFSNLNYSTEIRDRDFDLDILFHGPYLGVTFRF